MRTVLKLTTVGLAALLAPACLRPGAARGEAESPWVERETLAMGTVLRFRLAAGERREALDATERVRSEVARLETVLSSWTDESEVGRLNAAPAGEPVALSAELWALLDEASRWSAASGGAFDPLVGALVDAWDLRGEGRLPTAAELDEALAASGARQLRLHRERRTAALASERAWIDTGGFGKGAALRAAAGVLRSRGVRSALLDFGGQLLAVGSPPREVGWEVAVAHPSRREEPAVWLRLRDVSASTSSQSERWVEAAGERIGHLLDPRTGRPVPAWGSVTVVSEDAMVADILSTALFVLGPERGREWAERLDGVGVLFLEERGDEVVPSWNSAFERYRLIKPASGSD